ncbi:MAG: hypothetical protein A2600_11970 [Candidatus Lambdaproteobacteria bacterium RIFOXYD1_FULL_56_27]|nr:MAG: hypothetical protein A2426_10510 [Candidatus Lambdaproteobacteria bacterium RIFOXYC1_FULL_56_13]OGH09847.1 MAG: hypothetical protein A2600_11970 [Candidatus Lambdaproteobacteria bacterium RIFOXYD1_FULL_56_27]
MTELLAPAGDLEKLKIALAYGADAVYLALQRFGLRSGADNFTARELALAVGLAHQGGKKVYLALNGVLHDEELQELQGFLSELPRPWPDGVICSDLGVMERVARHTGLPIHVSTQASVLNSWAARLYKDLGASRIVLGREVSLEEAARIKDACGLEVELFVHGAMCMSYSGQCTLSNYRSGRDANRGGCDHSCRFAYQLNDPSAPPSPLLSSQDLNGLGLLKRFEALGLDSAKIEGRKKSSLYLATTLRAYRAVLDQPAPDLDFWQGELNKISHRSYGTGNLLQAAGADSVDLKEHEEPCDYEMAGTVLAADPAQGRVAFGFKNRFYLDMKLEFLGFGGETIESQVLSLTDLAGTPLELAQPGQVAWIDLNPPQPPLTVARIAAKALQRTGPGLG